MDTQNVTTIGNRVIINGEELPLPPNTTRTSYCRVTVLNGDVFINGYQWKDGKWKRTLRSLFHLVF